MNKIKQQCGFTLLELLMVVSIMSATAYVALGTLNNEGNNQRYQETSDRLEMIERAVVGRHITDFNGRYLQSGYVVDNGVLPVTIDDLTRQATDFVSYGAQQPMFDSQPDSNGMNNGGGVTLITANQLLYKGFRSSVYLNLKPNAVRSKDGWGNDWQINQPAVNSWRVSSYGRNNQLAGDELFDDDVEQTIFANGWQLDVAGWQVQVSNQSGVDINFAMGACLRLSLLVFENNATESSHWKRLSSACITGNTASGSCLDGDGDGKVNAVNCLATASVVFPVTGGGIGGYQPATTIPQGEHLLLLVADTNSNNAHADETESAYLTNSSQRVRFYAGMVRPDITLVIQ